MSEIRRVYLQTAFVVVELLRSPRLAEAWEEISVLTAFRVRGLAAHLARSIVQVREYLEAQISGQPPITAASYFARLEGTDDIGSELNMSVRDRGDALADDGLDALIAAAEKCVEELVGRLDAEPPARRVTVFDHQVMLLDEYLKTRLVEFVVHAEDLALSIGSGVGLPADAIRLATDTAVAATRNKHGDLAFLRGLTRRERDTDNATRLL